jgi:hypothetical protein
MILDTTPVIDEIINSSNFKTLSKNKITTSEIILLSKHANMEIHALTRGISLFPRKTPPEPSQKYLDLMLSFKILHENKMYQQSITKNNIAYWDPKDFKKVNSFIVSIINVLFSVVAVFFCVFYMADAVQMDISFRVLTSLFASAVVAFAELWFFFKDLNYSDSESE